MCENQIEINKDLLQDNNKLAEENKEWLKARGAIAVNIMGSPGSGKTTLIEKLAKNFNPAELAVIQGDLEEDVDKKRLEKLGLQTHQINTHSGCHLNAQMIKDALLNMNLETTKFVLIENVGNLVCPAGVQLGETYNIVVSSSTEGDDKPKKYPVIFHNADAIVLSKMDIAEHTGFNKKEYINSIKKLNPEGIIVEMSRPEEHGGEKVAELIKSVTN
ncbi:MAG: hydrogenase nickel incorporation protein HypB [Candidatus Nanoarchaeia archaeon]